MKLASSFRDSPNLVSLTRASDGCFVDVNPAFVRILGWKLAELRGRTPLDIEAWRTPAQRDEILQQLKQEGVVSNAPASFVTRSGQAYDGFVSVEMVHDDGEDFVFSIVREISLHDELKATMRRAEERYRSIIENANEGFYQSSLDGRLLSANPAMARLLGYETPNQILREIDDIGHQLYAEPGAREEILDRIATQGRVTGQEIELHRRDGTRIWVTENARAVFSDQGELRYFEGSLEDITVRKQAQDALRRSEERYRALVDQSQDGIFVAQDGCYLYVNRAFARMLGYSRQEMIGMDYMRIVAPEDKNEQLQRRARRMAGSRLPHAFETRYLKRDGHTRVLVSVRNTAIEYGDGVASLGTVRDITEERRHQWQLKYNATHDPLTGLANRALFFERLDQTLQKAEADLDYHYAVLFVDLDGFKLVNDSLGHAVGDRMLIDIARRIEHCVGEEGLLARHGGDEFTILLEGFSNNSVAETLAQRVLEQFSSSFRIGDHDLFSSASVGVVLDNPFYSEPDQVLRDADTAMYQAKARGKAAYVMFDQSMHTTAKARLALETELRLALEREEFVVHYQPIVELTSGKIDGVEALVRWQHPQRGLLLPKDFLDVAEEIGVVLPLDWWVLETACKQLVSWQHQFPELGNLNLHVNVDNRQFHHPAMLQKLRRSLAQTGMRPPCLQLEITESIFRDDMRGLQRMLERLTRLGVRLHVDDFGTGYSSLDSLSNLQFHGLKIDRSFIQDLESNSRHRAIVKTILRFAADLEIGTVAEGVDKPEQVAILEKCGCILAQGFLYSHALCATEMEALLIKGEVTLTQAANEAIA